MALEAVSHIKQQLLARREQIMTDFLRAETVMKVTSVHYPDGFDNRYTRHLQNNHIPILLSNHQGHADGIALALVTRRLTTLSEGTINGFVLPVATSLTTGAQSQLLKGLYDFVGPQLAPYNLSFLQTTRPKDQRDFNMATNLREYLKSLRGAFAQNQGIAFFPEGTLDGGRKGEFGKPKGMQPFTKGSIGLLVKEIQRRDKKPLYIPIGIEGGNKIIDPNTKKPTIELIKLLLGQKANIHLGVNVGYPLTDKDISELIFFMHGRYDPTKQDETLGRLVASLLPTHSQGVYK